MRIKLPYVLFMPLVLAAGCKNNQTSDAETEKITKQRDSLLEASVRKDSCINTFLSSFNEIENNLANIRARQENLALQWNGGVEIKKNVQEQVMEDVKAINDLMEQNAKKIEALNSIIHSNDNRIRELNGMVDVLIQHIKDKNHELSMLNSTLTEKNKELTERNRIIFHVPH